MVSVGTGVSDGMSVAGAGTGVSVDEGIASRVVEEQDARRKRKEERRRRNVACLCMDEF